MFRQSHSFFYQVCLLFTALIGMMHSLCAAPARGIEHESASRCRLCKMEEHEVVTVTFNVSGITDPNATLVGFLHDTKEGRTVATPLPISLPTGSGSLGPLSITISRQNALTFGVKILSHLVALSSGEVQAAVTTGAGTTIYDLNPASSAFIIDVGSQAGVLECTLPVALL